MQCGLVSDRSSRVSGRLPAAFVPGLLLVLALVDPRALAGQQPSSPVDPTLRQRSVDVLRSVLQTAQGGVTEQRWIKVHAAEFLLQLDHPQGVWDTFELEREARENEPQYRIGIWRVLAKAAGEERRCAEWANRISDVFFDPSASDRLHAMESLGKLRTRIPRELREPFVQATAEPTGAMTVFARWVLLNSGVAGAEQRLTELLESSDEDTRRLCGYVLGRVRTLSEPARARLAAAAQREAPESAARVTLVAAAALHAPPESKAHCKQQLLEYVRSGQPEQRIRACEALGSVASPSELPLLMDLLGNADADLRAAAAWAVLRLDRRVPRCLGLADWIVIALYAIGMLAVGWYYWRRSDTSE